MGGGGDGRLVAAATGAGSRLEGLGGAAEGRAGRGAARGGFGLGSGSGLAKVTGVIFTFSISLGTAEAPDWRDVMTNQNVPITNREQ